MRIFNALKACETAEDLSNFLIQLQPSIGKLGGRRFCVKDQVGSISLRDIVKRLDEIYKKSPLIASTFKVIEKIKTLDDQANQLLIKTNILIRILTAVKRWMGNLGFNRTKILSFIQSDVDLKIQQQTKQILEVNLFTKESLHQLAMQDWLGLQHEVKNVIGKWIETNQQILNDSAVVEDLLKINTKITDGLQDILIEKGPKELLITLQTETEKVNFFQPFLVQKSPYFNNMARFMEGKTRQISLQDDTPEAIQLLFSFLKTGQVVLTFENAIEGLVVADKYQVKELKDKYQRWIMDNCDLTCDNVIEWLAIADKSQAKELKDKCQRWIWNQNGDTFNLWEIVDKFDATLLREALLQRAVASKDISILKDRGLFLNKVVLANNSSEDMLELLQFCPNISYLQLTSCQGLKDLKKIRELKNLTSLELIDCQQLTDMSKLILPNLTSLGLSWCEQLTDAAVKEIAATLPKLTSLDLSGCEQLTNAAVKEIAAGLPKLTSLDLSWCEKLTDEAVKEIAAGLPKLTSLNLSGCEQLTNAAVKEIAAGLPKLTSLDLSGCKQLTDEAVKEIAAGLPKLTSLDLSGCKQLTDEAVKEIAAGLPKLTSLDLSGCEQLTDAAVKEIAAGLPKLTSLRLSWCEKLADEAVKEIAATLPKLTNLDLSGCGQLTDEAVKEIAAGLPKLTSLRLSWCEKLTDEAVKEIAAGLPKLTSLNLSGCGQLTDEAVKEIAARLPNLTLL